MPKLITDSGEIVGQTNDYSPASVARLNLERDQHNAKNPDNMAHVVMRGDSPTYSTTKVYGAKHGGLVSRGWGKARLPGGRT